MFSLKRFIGPGTLHYITLQIFLFFHNLVCNLVCSNIPPSTLCFHKGNVTPSPIMRIKPEREIKILYTKRLMCENLIMNELTAIATQLQIKLSNE